MRTTFDNKNTVPLTVTENLQFNRILMNVLMISQINIDFHTHVCGGQML